MFAHMIKTRVLSTREVAARLRVSRPTVHRMVRRGELTVVRQLSGLRGAYLFDAEEVDTVRRRRAVELAALSRLIAGTDDA